jgi:hypothetical protein
MLKIFMVYLNLQFKFNLRSCILSKNTMAERKEDIGLSVLEQEFISQLCYLPDVRF